MTYAHENNGPESDAHYLAARVENALGNAEDCISLRDVGAASNKLSSVYNSNRIRLVGRCAEFNMNLKSANVGNIGLATLAFGAEVEIEQSGDRPFFLVTTQLSGSSSIATTDGVAGGGRGFIVVDTAGQRVVKRFRETLIYSRRPGAVAGI